MAREKKVSSARRWADQQKTGERTALNLPKGVKFFKPKAGESKRINILPYTAGKGNPYADEGLEHFERTYWAHFGIGPNNGAYICPAKTANKKCPICEHAQTLARSEEADDADAKKLLQSLKPKRRQLWNVEDLNEPGQVLLFDVSFYNFGERLVDELQASDEDDGYDFFYKGDESGKTLKVGFKEESMGSNKFVVASSINFKDREAIADETLEQAHNLDELINILPYDELKKIYLQLDDDADNGDSEDDDDAPPARKPRPKAEVDGEDDDPKPTPKPKAKPKDEDEWDDDDTPAAKPDKKTKPAAAEDDVQPTPPKPKKKSPPPDEDGDDDPPPKPKAKTDKKPATKDDDNWDNWDDD